MRTLLAALALLTAGSVSAGAGEPPPKGTPIKMRTILCENVDRIKEFVEPTQASGDWTAGVAVLDSYMTKDNKFGHRVCDLTVPGFTVMALDAHPLGEVPGADGGTYEIWAVEVVNSGGQGAILWVNKLAAFSPQNDSMDVPEDLRRRWA